MIKNGSKVTVFVLVVMMTISVFSLPSQSSKYNIESLGIPLGWTDDIRLTNNSDADMYPQLAIYGSEIHMVWFRPVLGISEIFYMCSKDNGLTWINPIQITSSGNLSGNPDIAVDEWGNIHIVWYQGGVGDYEIYYVKSSNYGQSWTPEKIISVDDTDRSESPSIAVSGLNIHVIWIDSRNSSESIPPNEEIYYSRSIDGGITWDDGLGNIGQDRRMTYAPYTSSRREIYAIGNTVHFIWGDGRDGPTRYDIYYKRSLDNGATWDDGLNNIDVDRRLTNLTSNHGDASMYVDETKLHVVWMDEAIPSVYNLYYVNSTDGGGNWSTPKLICNSGTSSNPTISAANGYVHIAWLDWRSGIANEIYYRNSTDEGDNWGTEVRLTYDGASITTPKIASTYDFTHIVWRDERDGNREIYYKRYEIPDINPPKINHVPILTAYIGQQTNITVNITDDVSVNKVLLNYTGVNATNYNVSMNRWNGNWSYDIPGQNNIGTVQYFIWANDTSGNANMTAVYSIPIYDVTSPEINHLPVASANIFDVINITANITDNVAVNQVFLDYTGVNGTPSNVSMNKWDGNYSFDIPGQTNTGFVDYFIWVNDTSDNDNMTLVKQIQINDLTKPRINHAPVISANIDELINITANITDDIDVNKVFLNYTDVHGVNQNITMNQWGGNYSFEIPGQSNSGFVSYFIWANDTSDNDNRTITYQIQIIDITDPEINHAPITSANIRDTINITANVTDDVNVNSVYLNYTGVNGTNYNVSMNKWNGNYSYEIPGQNTVGNVQYFIWANDSDGNDNRTVEHSIQINDVVKPEINHVPVVSANVGKLINITAKITDDVEVDKVYLNYIDVAGNNYNLSMNKYNDDWSYEITGQNDIGIISYFILANDTSGNDNQTILYQVQILDVVKPEFGAFLVSQLDDDTLNITIEVTDDVAVDTVFINYTDLQGVNHNVSMPQWNNNWSYAMPWLYQEVGEIECFFWANDTSGNTNRSFECSIALSDIYPPSVVSHTPSGINISISTVITITFDEPMNRISVQNAVTISPTIQISGYSWNADNTTLTITPLGNLSYNTTYNITVGTGAKDLAGNNLASGYSWEFTTQTEPIIYNPNGGIGEYWWIILILIVAIIITIYLFYRFRKEKDSDIINKES